MTLIVALLLRRVENFCPRITVPLEEGARAQIEAPLLAKVNSFLTLRWSHQGATDF